MNVDIFKSILTDDVLEDIGSYLPFDRFTATLDKEKRFKTSKSDKSFYVTVIQDDPEGEDYKGDVPALMAYLVEAIKKVEILNTTLTMAGFGKNVIAKYVGIFFTKIRESGMTFIHMEPKENMVLYIQEDRVGRDSLTNIIKALLSFGEKEPEKE